MSRGLDPFGTRDVGGRHASLVIGASLIQPGKTTGNPHYFGFRWDYAVALRDAYVANTGRFPESRHENYARAEQFTYRAKNARGLRILEAARG